MQIGLITKDDYNFRHKIVREYESIQDIEKWLQKTHESVK